MGLARAAALLSLVAMLAGCSILHIGGKGDRGGQKPEPMMSTRLVGRVLSQAPIGVLGKHFVEEPWFSYAVEPENALGTQVLVLSQRDDCPQAGDPDQAYLLRIEKRSLTFARPKKDQALVSDLVVTACAPVAR